MTFAVRRLPSSLRAGVHAAALLCCLAQGVGAGAAAENSVPVAPLGRLVPAGEHRLHLYCTGDGRPTVVLEAGLGGNHLDWILAQPQLSRTTRVCSYDRAGYGWSEPGPKPRTVERISGELALLLRNAGIDGPIVLVGHSFGGLLSLYYAGHHRDQVVGLVLVDSMHPEQFERFQEAGVDVPVAPAQGLIYGNPEMLTRGIPQTHQALAHDLARRASARASLFDELRNVHHSMAQVNAMAPAPPLRAEVIVHGLREWDRLYRDGRMEDLWIRLQADLVRRLGAERLVVASHSGHQIPMETPVLVEKIVRAVIRDVRAGRN